MLSKIFHKLYAIRMKLTIKSKDFTIICNNCLAGVFYNDLGLKFRSPTINLFMYPSDFVKFCLNLKYYINVELTEVLQEKYNYPVGKLEDIEIYFMHYKSFQEAKQCWNRRKKRINFDNLFVIMVDRDNCSAKDIENFKKIKYKKIFLTNKSLEGKEIFKIEGFDSEEQLGNIISYDKKCRYKRYYEQFNLVNL